MTPRWLLSLGASWCSKKRCALKSSNKNFFFLSLPWGVSILVHDSSSLCAAPLPSEHEPQARSKVNPARPAITTDYDVPATDVIPIRHATPPHICSTPPPRHRDTSLNVPLHPLTQKSIMTFVASVKGLIRPLASALQNAKGVGRTLMPRQTPVWWTTLHPT